MILEILGWLLYPAALVVLGMMVEDDWDSWVIGSMVFIGLLWLAQWFTGVKLYVLLMAHLKDIPVWAAIYIGNGVVWSFMKFYEKARKVTAGTIKDRAIQNIPSRREVTDSDLAHARREIFEEIFAKTPKWIAFWPASLAVSFFSSWLKEIFVMIADSFKAIYRKMFDMIIGE